LINFRKQPVIENEEHELRQRMVRAIANATGYGEAELNLLDTAELKDLLKQHLHPADWDSDEPESDWDSAENYDDRDSSMESSYWGGPRPAQKRFDRALKQQQNSPENKADRERFQRELDRIMPPPKKEPEDKDVGESDLEEITRRGFLKGLGAAGMAGVGIAAAKPANARVTIGPDGKPTGEWKPTPVDPNAPPDPEEVAKTQQRQRYEVEYDKWVNARPVNTDGRQMPASLDTALVQRVLKGEDPNQIILGRSHKGTFGSDPSKYQELAKQWLDWLSKMPKKPDDMYERKDLGESTLNEFDHARHVKLLNAHMQKLGYENIGAGTDAQVFAKETGPVKKILMPKSGDISTAENSFLAFYNYCQANARNPHLPKFHQIQDNIELDGERFRQITMERLEEVDPEYEDMLVSMTDGIEDGTPLDPQYQPYIKFYQTLKSVMLTGRKLGFENDIITFQSVNIMQRGDTLVIIDPWTGGGGLEEDVRIVPRHVPVSESVENIMAALIDRIIVKEAGK